MKALTRMKGYAVKAFGVKAPYGTFGRECFAFR